MSEGRDAAWRRCEALGVPEATLRRLTRRQRERYALLRALPYEERKAELGRWTRAELEGVFGGPGRPPKATLVVALALRIEEGR